jgi:hypothetical protein
MDTVPPKEHGVKIVVGKAHDTGNENLLLRYYSRLENGVYKGLFLYVPWVDDHGVEKNIENTTKLRHDLLVFKDVNQAEYSITFNFSPHPATRAFFVSYTIFKKENGQERVIESGSVVYGGESLFSAFQGGLFSPNA